MRGFLWYTENMKELWSKVGKSKWFFLGLIIVLQTVVYLAMGAGKNYIHMDEGYSYGLANYDRVEIIENEDFYDQWHDAAYYEDYLAVQEDELGDFAPVYNNQRDDVHPPLYYFFLRIAMELATRLGGNGHFSVWPGIVLNIIIMAVTTVLVFLIAEKLLGKDKNGAKKALGLTLVAMLTVAAVDTVIYIRMYCLLAMMVASATYLHLRLLESEKPKWGLLVAIGVTALLGVLTQYYFLFYLVPMYLYMAVYYGRVKKWRELGKYTGALAVAGVLSLVVWPHSLTHMFFGYRGQGVMDNLKDSSMLLGHLTDFGIVLNNYIFHGIFILLIVLTMGLMVRGLVKGKRLKIEPVRGRGYMVILIATIVYFLIAAVASPYQTLRYIMAIGEMSVVLMGVGLMKLVGMFWQGKKEGLILAGLAVIFLVTPWVFKIQPDTFYAERAGLVEQIEERNVPTAYVMDAENNRFLDDILLFSKLDQSYIAKDLAKNKDGSAKEAEEMSGDLRKILRGKDLSEGVLIFINNGQDNEEILEAASEATGLEEVEWLVGLFAGNVYYLR